MPIPHETIVNISELDLMKSNLIASGRSENVMTSTQLGDLFGRVLQQAADQQSDYRVINSRVNFEINPKQMRTEMELVVVGPYNAQAKATATHVPLEIRNADDKGKLRCTAVDVKVGGLPPGINGRVQAILREVMVEPRISLAKFLKERWEKQINLETLRFFLGEDAIKIIATGKKVG